MPKWVQWAFFNRREASNNLQIIIENTKISRKRSRENALEKLLDVS